MRPRPKVFLELPTDDYARLIGWGWDTIQEAHPFAPDGALVARLEEGKRAAQEARANGEGVAQIDIHGEPFLIHATGAAGGVAYRLENDDMIFLLRSASCEWGASVRFKAAGLWEHGWQGLRERAVDFFDGSLERKLPDEPRISRADYAFDFFSVAFSGEFDFGRLRPLLVCHSSSKARWHSEVIGTSRRDQTFTVGRPNSLQLTVYDKAAEINEISGKTWMEEVWAQTTFGEILYADKPEHVWRLEVRMGKGYLKERNAQPVSVFLEFWRELIEEALTRVRLSSPNSDDACIRHRPLHPLWSLAFEHIRTGRDQILPIGRRVVGRRDALLARAAAQIAGAARSAAILSAGDASPDGLQVILRRAAEIAQSDPKRGLKEDAARARYEFVDEAK